MPRTLTSQDDFSAARLLAGGGDRSAVKLLKLAIRQIGESDG
jgi:hypothetical protein